MRGWFLIGFIGSIGLFYGKGVRFYFYVIWLLVDFVYNSGEGRKVRGRWVGLWRGRVFIRGGCFYLIEGKFF